MSYVLQTFYLIKWQWLWYSFICLKCIEQRKLIAFRRKDECFMEQKLYVYRSHDNGCLSASIIKYHKDCLRCHMCGQYDKLVFVGTKDEVIKRYEDKITEFRKLLIGDVPRYKDMSVIKRALKRAERDLQNIMISLDRCNLL